MHPCASRIVARNRAATRRCVRRGGCGGSWHVGCWSRWHGDPTGDGEPCPRRVRARAHRRRRAAGIRSARPLHGRPLSGAALGLPDHCRQRRRAGPRRARRRPRGRAAAVPRRRLPRDRRPVHAEEDPHARPRALDRLPRDRRPGAAPRASRPHVRTHEGRRRRPPAEHPEAVHRHAVALWRQHRRYRGRRAVRAARHGDVRRELPHDRVR